MSAVMERESKPGRNLRVKGPGTGFYFGDSRHGTVLPKWVAEQSGSTAEQLVAEGVLEWTDDVAVGSWKAPSSKNEVDAEPMAAMSEELDRLRRQNFEFLGQNKVLSAENAELRLKADLQTKQLGEQSNEIAHWRELSEGYRVQVETLTSGYTERDQTCQSLTDKNKELEDRLAALLRVPAPSDKPKSEKKAEKTPTG